MDQTLSADAAPGFRKILIYCLLAYLASRGALTIIGVAAQTFILPLLPPQSYRWHEGVAPWLDVWGAWDSGWFIGIVEGGYMTTAVAEPAAIKGQANWPFFPLFPMLARLVSQTTGASGFVSLVIVANVAFFAALLVAWTETRDLYGRRAADTCVLLLCVIPGTHFLSSAYSESLFLLCCLATLALARRRYWLAAGATAALATLTRNVGIILIIPILLYFIESPRPASLRERLGSLRVADVLPLVAGLSLPVIALGGYMAYLYALTGDALAFAHVQAAWGRKFNSPITVLLVPDADLALVPHHIAAWISLALVGVLFWRRNWPHAAYAALCVTIFLTAGILSFMRLALSVAPLLLVGSDLIAARPQGRTVILCCSAALSALLMIGWSIGVPVF